MYKRQDHDLVELAFTNLAVNAIEAMEPHRGRLFLKAYRDGADVIIEIMDNGRGVPPEELARLFEPYYSGRAGGLGLSLIHILATQDLHQRGRYALDPGAARTALGPCAALRIG